jgi:hypothetical protein
MIAVNLTAGQTYTWSYRPSGENGIVDPWLHLYADESKTTLIAQDDDGGLGRSSQITFTATTSGTYWLNATSWYQADPGAPDYQDNGDYTIVQWSPDAAHDAPNSLATTFELEVGTNYAYLDAAFDRDLYKVELTAGMVYTFTYNGGVSSGTDWNDEAGESIGVLTLLNSAGGTVVPAQVNYETGLTFVAQTSGTYYLQAQAYSNFAGVPGPEMTGGYTIDVREVALADMDPLESLHWDSASNVAAVDVGGVPTVYVYFAPAGENFGQTEATDDHPPGTPMTTYGWEQHQIDAVMHALNTQYTPITGINYVITGDSSEAQFRLTTTINDDFGARFYPNDPASYGSLAGVGTFNLASGGFGTLPESLLPGGFSYAVILHEFGHAHGVAHPHDTGGGSEIMLGVTAATGSYGLYNLNQGVYTVMSYNDAWDFHPDGPTSEHPTGAIGAVAGHGWSETLGAFDIAVLQQRYGVHANATGDNNYVLTDDYLEASYKTIWDSAGNDTISYAGNLDAHIDLLAATLDYSPTGGGVISFVHNEPQNDGNPADDYITEIKGGYTIANGVVVENATGGSGDDLLLGNSANNVLTGNDGNDTLGGRTGIDLYRLGAGADTAIISLDNSKVDTKVGSVAYDIIADFDGTTDKIDFSDLDAKLGTAANDAFTWIGTNANKEAGNLSYKVYDSINGAEKALGIEIDNFSGAYSGKVTVVMANVDGGGVDYAVVLLGAPQLSAADFVL